MALSSVSIISLHRGDGAKLIDDLNRDALRYQELYYTERKHISHLDEQRCAGYSAGEQLPA